MLSYLRFWCRVSLSPWMLVWSGLLLGVTQRAMAQANEQGPSDATAQSAPDAAESKEQRAHRAIALGHQALSAFESSNHVQALSLFGQADALLHSPVFVLYQARSAQALGRYEQALALYGQCAGEHIETTSPNSWTKSVQTAARELLALRGALTHVELEILGATSPGLEVQLLTPRAAGEQLIEEKPVVVPKDLLHSASQAVVVLHFYARPGNYQLRLNDAGHAPLVQQWIGRPGAGARIAFDLRRPRVVPPTNRAPMGPLAPPKTPSALRRGAYTALGSGAALLVVSLSTGATALGLAQAVKDHCTDGVCPYEEQQRVQRSLSFAQLATAALVGGLTGVTVGAILWWVDTHPQKTVRSRKVELSFRPQGVFLDAEF
jgi:tetratricopeptide (TPR) repeat protein